MVLVTWHVTWLDNFQRCPCRIFWRRNVIEPIDLSQMPDILLRDKLWGPLSWGKLSSFFSVVSALMCFDPWVWELPSLTLLRYMALTFHTLPYLIIPTHSYRTLSLTPFHPNDFFPCPRLPNNTYPPYCTGQGYRNFEIQIGPLDWWRHRNMRPTIPNSHEN